MYATRSNRYRSLSALDRPATRQHSSRGSIVCLVRTEYAGVLDTQPACWQRRTACSQLYAAVVHADHHGGAAQNQTRTVSWWYTRLKVLKCSALLLTSWRLCSHSCTAGTTASWASFCWRGQGAVAAGMAGCTAVHWRLCSLYRVQKLLNMNCAERTLLHMHYCLDGRASLSSSVLEAPLHPMSTGSRDHVAS
jgi:hypothetical protein